MAANKERDIMSLPIDQLTLEELQLRVMRMQMHRETLLLGKAEQDQKAWEAREAQRHRDNAMRQTEMAQIASNRKAIIGGCRHRQGGFRHKLYSGDGKSCVSKFVMPDGVTNFLQCSRCRLKFFTPHRKLQEREPAEYDRQMVIYARLMELHEESGLDMIKGPTFTFVKDGVPFIPEMVGVQNQI